MAVMKVIEIMAQSEKSWEDAAKQGVAEAAKTLKGLKSAWVQDQSVIIKSGEVVAYRVNLKVSFEIKSEKE